MFYILSKLNKTYGHLSIVHISTFALPLKLSTIVQNSQRVIRGQLYSKKETEILLSLQEKLKKIYSQARKL